MNTLSFRTPEATKAKLDFLANQQQRDRSFIINEAIDYYLSLQEWQLAHIKMGVEQVKKGEFASDEVVPRIVTEPCGTNISPSELLCSLFITLDVNLWLNTTSVPLSGEIGSGERPDKETSSPAHEPDELTI